VEPTELSEIAENDEVFRDLVVLLPRDPPLRKSGYENECINKRSFGNFLKLGVTGQLKLATTFPFQPFGENL